MKKIVETVSKKALSILEKRAEKKANAECIGFMYEPKIPKKLKKNVCILLACVLAVSGVLVGSADFYKADVQYYNESWQTIASNPGYVDVDDTVLMYYSPAQTYEWAVTSYTASSGFGMVTLSSTNMNITMVNGTNRLTQVGARQFKVVRSSSVNDYAVIRITMDYDNYVTAYSGYVKILG